MYIKDDMKMSGKVTEEKYKYQKMQEKTIRISVRHVLSEQTRKAQKTRKSSTFRKNTLRMNTLLENTLLENTLLENTFLENTLLENKLLENTLLKNTLYALRPTWTLRLNCPP